MLSVTVIIPTFCYFALLVLLLQENFTHARKFSSSIFFIFAIFLILFAVFRPSNLPDYKAYSLFYFTPNEDRFEFTADVIKFISPSFYVFLFFYALLSVNIKLKAIEKTSNFHFLSFLLYLVISYPLHELVQIRAGVAISLYLYAIHYLKQNKVKYILCILLAACFHYSALVALPFVVFNATTFKKKRWYFLIFASYFLYFIGVDFAKILLFFVDEGSYLYLQLFLNTEKTNVFNSVLLIYLFIFIILSKYYKRQNQNPYTCILLKILACSICILPLTASASIVTFRLFEFLGTAIIFLLPNLLYIFRKCIFGYCFFLLFFIFFFWQKIIRVGYFI